MKIFGNVGCQNNPFHGLFKSAGLAGHVRRKFQMSGKGENWAKCPAKKLANCIMPDILKVHYISQFAFISIVCLKVKNVQRRFSSSPDINVRRNLKMSGEGFMVRRSKCPAKLKIISCTLEAACFWLVRDLLKIKFPLTPSPLTCKVGQWFVPTSLIDARWPMGFIHQAKEKNISVSGFPPDPAQKGRP